MSELIFRQLVIKMSSRERDVGNKNQFLDDYKTKVETVNLLKQLKAQALEGDRVAAYRLAKIYPQNSSNYMKWMHKAVASGLTNAMLDMADTLVKTNSVAQLQLAANYLVRVLRSGDSYIIEEAKEFLADKRALSAEVNRQMNQSASLATAGFFAHNDTIETNRVTDERQLSLQ